ncbi:hypothetical protein LZP69_15155 [Shewanella sp. AS1]|uniref:hypothetical protein n=1 Tax=Shewanella sp. AS1 TaxID=2907626 RepID=UPI001F3F44DD|nr:hypothetical protein [Shewanella sp. AS1]MCE9680491.1 hypothetical protein [Shewanella sp. AS1]
MKLEYRYFFRQVQLDLAKRGSSNSRQFAQFLSLLLICFCLSMLLSCYVDGPELMQLLSNWFLAESVDCFMLGTLLAMPLYLQQLLCLCFIIYLLFYHLASERALYFALSRALHAVEYDAHGSRAPPLSTSL